MELWSDLISMPFPRGSVVRESSCQCRRGQGCRWDPWVRKTPGGGHGNPLQCSCLENPKDRGAWWATVRGVEKELDTTERLGTDRQTHGHEERQQNARFPSLSLPLSSPCRVRAQWAGSCLPLRKSAIPGTQAGTQSQTANIQNWEKANFYCLSHPVYAIPLQQPEQIHQPLAGNLRKIFHIMIKLHLIFCLSFSSPPSHFWSMSWSEFEALVWYRKWIFKKPKKRWKMKHFQCDPQR